MAGCRAPRGSSGRVRLASRSRVWPLVGAGRCWSVLSAATMPPPEPSGVATVRLSRTPAARPAGRRGRAGPARPGRGRSPPAAAPRRSRRSAPPCPGASTYTRACASAATAPQPAHRPTAAVTSTANTSRSAPAAALPSRNVGSVICCLHWVRSVRCGPGAGRARRPPAGRPPPRRTRSGPQTYDVGSTAGGNATVGQQARVQPARRPRPAVRRFAGCRRSVSSRSSSRQRPRSSSRVEHRAGVAHRVAAAGTALGAAGRRCRAYHRHQRHHARATGDQQHRPGLSPAARRTSRRPARAPRAGRPTATSSTRYGDTSPSGSRSTVISTRSPAGADAIEYERLRGVAVVGGEPDVDVLAGQVARPVRHVEDERARGRRLGPDGGHGRRAPAARRRSLVPVALLAPRVAVVVVAGGLPEARLVGRATA